MISHWLTEAEPRRKSPRERSYFERNGLAGNDGHASVPSDKPQGEKARSRPLPQTVWSVSILALEDVSS